MREDAAGDGGRRGGGGTGDGGRGQAGAGDGGQLEGGPAGQACLEEVTACSLSRGRRDASLAERSRAVLPGAGRFGREQRCDEVHPRLSATPSRSGTATLGHARSSPLAPPPPRPGPQPCPTPRPPRPGHRRRRHLRVARTRPPARPHGALPPDVHPPSAAGADLRRRPHPDRTRRPRAGGRPGHPVAPAGPGGRDDDAGWLGGLALLTSVPRTTMWLAGRLARVLPGARWSARTSPLPDRGRLPRRAGGPEHAGRGHRRAGPRRRGAPPAGPARKTAYRHRRPRPACPGGCSAVPCCRS